MSMQQPRTGYGRPGFSLYFAYGSNMHVAQMAKRCPESIFVGKATLPGYRWQINQRGVANVVPQPDEEIQGLAYLVNKPDEKRLDRNEGVKSKLYSRHLIKVLLEPHYHYDGVPSTLLANVMEDRSKAHAVMYSRNPGMEQALVYVSETFCDDGAIRTEYIKRMEDATDNAARLGVLTCSIEREIARSKNRQPMNRQPTITESSSTQPMIIDGNATFHNSQQPCPVQSCIISYAREMQVDSGPGPVRSSNNSSSDRPSNRQATTTAPGDVSRRPSPRQKPHALPLSYLAANKRVRPESHEKQFTRAFGPLRKRRGASRLVGLPNLLINKRKPSL